MLFSFTYFITKTNGSLCLYEILLFIVLAFWKQEFLVKSSVASKLATKHITDYILDS